MDMHAKAGSARRKGRTLGEALARLVTRIAKARGVGPRAGLLGLVLAGVLAVLGLAGPTQAQSEPAKVYAFTLDGWFGKDVSETPIAECLEEARQLEADYIIITVDTDWYQFGDPLKSELPEDVIGQFDQFFRTKKMAPLFQEQMLTWKKKPKVVFWVKQAMGGAAFLPFMSDTMYFHPEGKIGGIQGIYVMFGEQGDRVVIEKQISLRLTTAQGIAIQNGYEPKLIEAMTRGDYVLSYKLEGGRPVYLEREPQSPDEFLLTNNALQEDNRDTIEDLARGRGVNWLTLKADIAQILGVSKGTVETMDDLLFELGILRNHVMVGNGDKIMDDWSASVKRAEEALSRLFKEYNEIQVQGDWNERRRARGQQRAKLQQMIGILQRYEEAIIPWQIPGFIQAGSATQLIPVFRRQLQRIELEQLADER
ncbi:MAG: hypothetical protein KatS3mg103_1428 [Phycisphaerales bacterium]|nr:MAG: hypothetical protein KatS3mg103_1428 [Phycisphaerales bacterium]